MPIDRSIKTLYLQPDLPAQSVSRPSLETVRHSTPAGTASHKSLDNRTDFCITLRYMKTFTVRIRTSTDCAVHRP